MNKEIKQNCWESRQSSAARGSRISWAEPLPGTGLLQESSASLNTHSRTQIQSSCTSHFLCMDPGWRGTELAGRLSDLNNKAPMRPEEGRGKELLLDFFARWREPVSTR